MKAKIFLLTTALFLLTACSKSTDPIGPDNKNIPSGPVDFINDSQLFISFADLFKDVPDADYVDDIKITADYIFFHPSGPLGLYRYNRANKQTEELVSYPSGNYIALDGDFIFYETSGYSIYRYNLSTAQTDLTFDLSSISYTNIDGLAAANNTLYVHFHSQQDGSHRLILFNYDGSLRETIPIEDRVIMNMEVNGHVLYMVGYHDGYYLYRYDLDSKRFLDDIEIKEHMWSGLSILDGILYYADYTAKEVRMIALEAIK